MTVTRSEFDYTDKPGKIKKAMKKIVFRILIAFMPFIALIGYYRFFYEEKLTDEDSHISKLIEKLPEYIDLSNQNSGSIHIDFPRDTSSVYVIANLLTFNINNDPAKIICRIKYDKILDSIVSIKKEQ